MNETNKFSKYKKTMMRRGILVWIPTLLSAASFLLFRFQWSPLVQSQLTDFMLGFQDGMVLALLVTPRSKIRSRSASSPAAILRSSKRPMWKKRMSAHSLLAERRFPRSVGRCFSCCHPLF